MTEVGKGKRLLALWVIIAYCLIGIEIIIMISPFALYFYWSQKRLKPPPLGGKIYHSQ